MVKCLESIVLTVALHAFVAAPAGGESTREIIAKAPWIVHEVVPGVTARTCSFDNLFGGRQEVFVADVDMNTSGVSLRIKAVGDGTRNTVSAWAAQEPEAVVATNGAWCNPQSGIPDQFLRINGTRLAVTHPLAQERGGIAVTTQGKVQCRTLPDGGWASLTEPDVMASEVPSVVNGQPYPWADPQTTESAYYYEKRAPRSAIGVTEQNHILLVVVDGRRPPAALGVTYAHVAELMIALGAVHATELDGGGSSTLWARGLGVLNKPSDGHERKVGIALVVTAPGPQLRQ